MAATQSEKPALKKLTIRLEGREEMPLIEYLHAAARACGGRYGICRSPEGIEFIHENPEVTKWIGRVLEEEGYGTG